MLKNKWCLKYGTCNVVTKHAINEDLNPFWLPPFMLLCGERKPRIDVTYYTSKKLHLKIIVKHYRKQQIFNQIGCQHKDQR